MKIFFTVLALALFAQSASAVHNIVDYGAIPNASAFNLTACQINGKAFYDAVQAAHQSTTGDRTVLIPDENFGGRGGFAFVPYKVIDGIYNVTIRLDGILDFFKGNTRVQAHDPHLFVRAVEIHNRQVRDHRAHVDITEGISPWQALGVVAH